MEILPFTGAGYESIASGKLGVKHIIRFGDAEIDLIWQIEVHDEEWQALKQDKSLIHSMIAFGPEIALLKGEEAKTESESYSPDKSNRKIRTGSKALDQSESNPSRS